MNQYDLNKLLLDSANTQTAYALDTDDPYNAEIFIITNNKKSETIPQIKQFIDYLKMTEASLIKKEVCKNLSITEKNNKQRL